MPEAIITALGLTRVSVMNWILVVGHIWASSLCSRSKPKRKKKLRIKIRDI